MYTDKCMPKSCCQLRYHDITKKYSWFKLSNLYREKSNWFELLLKTN